MTLLLFVRQCLLVIIEIGSVTGQWMYISQVTLNYDAILHFVFDSEVGTVCFELIHSYILLCVCV